MANTRNGLEIRAELLRQGKTLTAVAAKAGVSRSLVSQTVYGKANNRRVLQALVDAKVPTRLLDLPEDMKHGKEAA